MDMNFPHPKQNAFASQPAGGFALLVATAVARQLASKTARTAPADIGRFAANSDPVEARISYFGNREARRAPKARGAFLPHSQIFSLLVNKDEIAVYPDASANGKTKVVDDMAPKESAAMRGMED